MARYIDADAMKDDVIKLRRKLDITQCSNDYAVGWITGVDNMEGVIDRQPTADVVEVVRCKDCKYYDGRKCDKIYYIMDGYYVGGFEVKKPDDFCSYGERK